MRSPFTLIIALLISFPLFVSGAWINFEPQTITQPDGSIIHCFATGDEFYNWMHDEEGYTLIQNHSDGFYYFAQLSNGILEASPYRVGSVNPATVGLSPWTNISTDKMKALRADFYKKQMPPKHPIAGYASPKEVSNLGTLNNLVVYIRFSDQTEFPEDTMQYYNMFNNNTSGYNSLLNYFETVSYDKISIPSWFYPQPSGPGVISYQDTYPRSYFMPYDPVTNPDGYQSGQSGPREHALLKRACEFIADEVPTTLDIDKNNDGYIDNMVFTVKGATTAWATLLWPHRWSLYGETVYINGKRAWDYNLQVEDHLNSSGPGVLCHEMFHSLSAPDLYHYTSAPYTAVGPWDIMDSNTDPPQSMGAYMKFKYGGWIDEIPEITECGTYTLNPLSDEFNNCFKIASPYSSSQYFVVEYRLAEGVFEGGLPGSGLLVYRIDVSQNGNAQGPPDEVYIYRPDGSTTNNGSLSQAHFAADYNRTEINDNTNPNSFLQNGQDGGLIVENIGFVGETISFDVLFEKEPVAEFSASEEICTPGCGVDFFDESACEVTSWAWTFEGATPASSTEQFPQGIGWSAPGTYSVSLTVNNPWGSNSLTKTAFIEMSESALPEIEFFASDSVVCTSQTLTINDFSSVCPDSWTWEISPASFEFVNNTNANSQNIEVILLNPVSYTVSLTVGNANGDQTLTKQDYLVAGGQASFFEDFETGDPLDRGWTIVNDDDDIGWEVFNISGNGGNRAAGVNFFNYFSIFKRDQLISPPLDLSAATSGVLSFEHAYAQSINTAYSDSLIVKISTDCGNSWTRISELGEDGSYNFATHVPYGYNFVPGTADDWCGGTDNAECQIIDISPYVGNPNCRIMFESVRLTGNNLYVDNVAVDISTSANEQLGEASSLFNVFPNPSKGIVSLHLNSNQGNQMLRIYNAMGSVIHQEDISGTNQTLIDLQDQPRGIYLLGLTSNGKTVFQKIVLN